MQIDSIIREFRKVLLQKPILKFANLVYYLSMQFELTEALIDDILFSMEDQNGEFLLDTVESMVVGGMDGLGMLEEEDGADDDESGSRYISLPEWDSASGFRLMERFAAGFRNPLVREELSGALGRGRGVFRAFKDTLGRYPEAEKVWFSFKEKEMRREIARWYNGLREEWGLEKIGGEPEETGDLVLEDFHFRAFQKEDMARAEELHRLILEEFRGVLTESGAGSSVGALLAESQIFRGLPAANVAATAAAVASATADASTGMGLIAESGNGEFAGYIFAIAKDASLYIQNLEVKAEFRGLGVGESLLAGFLKTLDPNKVGQVFLDLPSWAEGFSRVVLREFFKPYSVRYWFKVGSGE